MLEPILLEQQLIVINLYSSLPQNEVITMYQSKVSCILNHLFYTAWAQLENQFDLVATCMFFCINSLFDITCHLNSYSYCQCV